MNRNPATSSAITSLLTAYQEGHLDRSAAQKVLNHLRAGNRASEDRELARRTSELEGRIWSLLAERCEMPSPSDAAMDTRYADLGISSADQVFLVDSLESELGITLLPTLVFDHPTPRRTAAYLTAKGGKSDVPRPSRADRMAPTPHPSLDRVPSAAGVRDVAVIGMAGRFPGADSIDAFWAALLAGEDLLTPVPPDRWDHSRLLEKAAAEGRVMSPRGGFLNRVDLFAARRFGISPREAATLDPQVRLLLEIAWDTAEDAGVAHTLEGSSTGVFAGMSFRDYEALIAEAGQPVGAHDATGMAATMAANRVSFAFDLRGPSMTVDTACSSSLVAVHQAVQALRAGECDMALAAGTNLILAPRHYEYLASLGALSEHGRCDAFGPDADGYVPAEAVAAVLLKPLEAALNDGDPIRAVIKGSATLHGGRTASLTAPAPQSQADLLVRAWKDAGTEPSRLGFIEAHGTGTALGDPVEIDGILAAFNEFGVSSIDEVQHTDRCVVSSAKAHLGHAEAAAGIVGLIKAILTLEHGWHIAMPGYTETNPYCRVDSGPLRIDRSTGPWPRSSRTPRQGAVSSFGFGGTGAHVVLEEAPEPLRHLGHGPWLVPLSADDAETLSAWAQAILVRLRALPEVSVEGVVAQLSIGHEPQAHRTAFTASNPAELFDGLERVVHGDTSVTVSEEPALREMSRRWLAGERPDGAKFRSLGRWTTRTALPGRPLHRESHWFEPTRYASQRASDATTSVSLGAVVSSSPHSGVAPGPVRLHYLPTWNDEPADRSAPLPDGLVVIAGGPEIRTRAMTLAGRSAGGRAVLWHTDVVQQATVFADLRAALEGAGQSTSVAIMVAPAGPDLQPPQEVRARLSDLSDLVAAVVTAWRASERTSSHTLRVVVLVEPLDPVGTAHSGMARAAAWDQRIGWNSVEVPRDLPDSDLAELVASELAATSEGTVCEVRRDERGRRRLGWSSYTSSATEPGFRPGGRYLITGGVGGIGRAVGEHLASRYGARLVLTGRSAKSDSVDQHLKAITQLGGDAVYVRADAADHAAMTGAVALAHARFGGLDGVIHLAGALVEVALDRRDEQNLSPMVIPKVDGILILDDVTCGERLDLFLAVASMSGVIGTPLLGDYSTCSRFLDAFMEERHRKTKVGARSGVSLALDLPYWRDGGMPMPDSTVRIIEDATGMIALDGVQGAGLLDEAVGIAVAADASRIASALGNAMKSGTAIGASSTICGNPEPGTSTPDAATNDPLLEGLREHARSVLCLPAVPNPEDELTSLGFESVTVHEFVRDVSGWLGVDFDAATFFEHRTLASLADHLVKAHSANIAQAAHGARITEKRSDALPTLGPYGDARVGHLSGEPDRQRGSGPRNAVAIIGMAGQLPGAVTLAEFWESLVSGRDAVRGVATDRFAWEEHSGPVPRCALLPSVADFDPDFFHVTRREAAVMDPQQRLVLMTAHDALADAAVPYDALAGTRTGVFVGVSNVDHADVLNQVGMGGDAQSVTGLAHGMVANRLSYHLNLRGPSEAVDTACSSSLVALHRAVRALHAGECDTAIVAGVNVLTSARPFLACSQAGMLSKTGCCSTFGANADGYVRGEGVLAMVLRREVDADEAGDPVRALIRGIGTSHHGHSHGLTIPDPLAQAELITSVHRSAEVEPHTVGLVEAHGTGTQVGDPIEVNGLLRAFDELGAAEGPAWCGLGSVKSGIGHLEAAAGLAGVAKVVMATENGLRPATLHSEPVNPQIHLEGSPLFLLHESSPWPRPVVDGGEVPRRAAVSAFGFGGVNAHLVVEEAEPRLVPQGTSTSVDVPLLLSARSESRLRAYADRLATYLERHPETRLVDMAETLATGRTHETERRVVSATSVAQAIRRLREFAIRGVQDEPAVLVGVGQALRHWMEGGAPPPSLTGSGLRISLPGVPFELERCWPESPTLPPPPVAQRAVADKGGQVSASVPAHMKNVDRARNALHNLFARYLHLPLEQVRTDQQFDHVNLDSIGAQQVLQLMEEEVGPLPATLLYERKTIDALADGLYELRPTEVDAWCDRLGHSDLEDGAPALAEAVHTAADAAVPLKRPGAVGDQGVIAVVGMAGVFPGAPDVNALWRSLLDGADLITRRPAPLDRSAPSFNRGGATWAGGFIDDVDVFDAGFFGISPTEAELMDPQHRLFLHMAVSCIEDAGYSLSSFRGSRTGVFVGVSAAEYYTLVKQAGRAYDPYAPIGSSHAALANRVSFLLDLHGPSEPVDTACSSSLTAIHRAIRCIQAGDCDAAIAGGVNLLLTDDFFESFGSSGFLSPSARCQAFGAGADGYVRSEGAAVVLLKSMHKAERDGDNILGVIRGSGVNHGGRVRSLTVPSPHAQGELIADVQKRAGVSSRTVTYVETHGTGTPMGDPIELAGLREAFSRSAPGEATDGEPWCGLGSVKSNLGHMESASGATGLVKVLLAMQHGILPPSLHLSEVNPRLALEGSPFRLVDRRRPWTRLTDASGRPVPRRAGLSSFGFGGANAHLLVEERFATPRRQAVDHVPRGEVLILSAAKEEQLRRLVAAMAQRLDAFVSDPDEEDVPLRDIAHTLQVGRDGHRQRLAVQAHDLREGASLLRAYLSGDTEGLPIWSGTADLETARVISPEEDAAVVAQGWVMGARVDWERAWASAPRRVSLPTYPFARDRYWVSGAGLDELEGESEDGIEQILTRLEAGQVSIADVEEELERRSGAER